MNNFELLNNLCLFFGRREKLRQAILNNKKGGKSILTQKLFQELYYPNSRWEKHRFFNFVDGDTQHKVYTSKTRTSIWLEPDVVQYMKNNRKMTVDILTPDKVISFPAKYIAERARKPNTAESKLEVLIKPIENQGENKWLIM